MSRVGHCKFARFVAMRVFVRAAETETVNLVAARPDRGIQEFPETINVAIANQELVMDIVTGNASRAVCSGLALIPGRDSEVTRTTITLGDNSVELIHIPTPHAPDMTALRFPQENAIFFVDFLSLKRVPFRNIPGYSIAGFLNGVRAVEALDFRIAIGGHGSNGNRRDVRQHREYFEELRDAVAAGIADGDSLAEIQASVTMDDYDHWASHSDWVPFNVEGMYHMLTGM